MHRSYVCVQRRGVAMLLVIISLMMATILTTSYLASRDNSTAIGKNAGSAVAARWASDSGLDVGVTILQTQAPWRTSHVSGRLLSNYALAGATVNLDIADLETGLPPTAASEYVRLTSTAIINGVQQQSRAHCHVPIINTPVVDLDLSEFAVFASQLLAMKNKAVITRWPVAPLSSLGDRVRLGVRAKSASSVLVTDDAAIVDGTVYTGPGASNLLVSVARTQLPEKVSFGDDVLMPAPPAPGVAAPLIVSLNPVLTMNGGTATTNANVRWKSAELKSGAVRTFRGNIQVVTDEDFNVNSNSKAIIDGDVKLVVFGDLKLDKGSIELKSGARLRIFVRGRSSKAVDLHEGYIGNLRADTTRDVSGNASYMDPDRVQMYSIAPTGSALNWRIEANTLIKASVYAPDPAKVEVVNDSAIYGRVATKVLALEDTATIFYDPGLNEQVGYTPAKSAIFNADGTVKTEFKSLASLDRTALQALVDSKNILMRTVDGLLSYPGYTPTTAAAGPSDPTPRPILVKVDIETFGTDPSSWE